MTATTFLTELDALNMMLTAADEAPVQTATQSGHLPLSIAKAVLNDTSRMVQSKGWAFNTEDGFPLSRDTSGQIPLAPNVLSLDVDDVYGVSPIQRGVRLYDRAKHTYTFDRDLTGTVILCLPWDELPQAARHYIAVRAARTFQTRMQAGESVHALTEEDELHALHAMSSLEADTADANFLTDSQSVSEALIGRYFPSVS
jgi:hypothetical protein